MNYCSHCGGSLRFDIPPRDDRSRYICDACQTIFYENPKMVVGCIPEWKDQILLCRRAIEPRYGMWTLPAGFLENGETVSEGAIRETYEEAGTRVKIIAPYMMLNLSFISQIYFMFRARMLSPDYEAGQESLDVRLFKEEEIPWKNIAFSAISSTLKQYFYDRTKGGSFSFHIGDVQKV